LSLLLLVNLAFWVLVMLRVSPACGWPDCAWHWRSSCSSSTPVSSQSPCRTASSASRCACAWNGCCRRPGGRFGEFELRQLVALRFAGDGELADLARRVLAGELRSSAQIKRQIKDWQADWLRA